MVTQLDAARPLVQRDANFGIQMLGMFGLAESETQRQNPLPRVPEFHDSGFSLAIDTPEGVVGVWSSWLRNGILLGYPRSVERLKDESIAAALGATKQDFSTFEAPGSIFIKHDSETHSSEEFLALRADGKFTSASYGGGRGNMVRVCSQMPYFPQSVAAESVLPLTGGFMKLASEVAALMGGARSVTAHFLDVMLPEQLEISGFHSIEPGTVQIFGERSSRRTFTARRASDLGEELVVLRQGGSSAFPFTPLRRVECVNGADAAFLTRMLVF